MSSRVLAALLTLLLAPLACASAVAVQLRVPHGAAGDVVHVQPNATLGGIVAVESRQDGALHCRARLVCHNCTVSPEEFTAVLRLRHDARAVPVEVRLGGSTAELRAVVECNGSAAVARKLFIPRAEWRVGVEVVAPSDIFCSFDQRYEPYTFIVRPSYVPELIRLITQESRAGGHPDLIGLVCIRVNSTAGLKYTAVLMFARPDGSPAPISTQSLLLHPELPQQHGTAVVPDIEGYQVVPLFYPGHAEQAAGRYRVTLLLIPQGSSRPVYNTTFYITVISTRGEAVALAAFSAFVAIPAMVYLLFRFARRATLGDLAFAALMAPLLFVTVYIPGSVARGIGAFLGPFDWLVYGILFDTVEFALLAIAVTLRPKPGVLTAIFFFRWLLSVLYFGRASVISALWLATSALFYEGALYLSGATRGRPTFARVAVPLVLGGAFDRYVDMVMYMALYRLYYAGWYLLSYVIGTSVYSALGALLGRQYARVVRGALHE